MAATPSSSSFPPSSVTNPTPSDSSRDFIKQIRGHEVAIAELGSLSSSRLVYQRNGNIFFRTTIQKATTFEQRQLDDAKAKLQKLTSS